MKVELLAVVLMLVPATQAQQTDTQYTKPQHAAMMERGDKGMGFPQEKTTHHFQLLEHGGTIQVTVNDRSDTENLEHIRVHLSQIATMFSAGDFDVPMFVHDTKPPGAPTMSKMHKEIQYRYREIGDGAKITIHTENPEALKAIHDFLRFQIAEHHTEDSTNVR